MTDQKIIAVLGATGAQGGALCAAILADPTGGFVCRAITRDPNKEQAKALTAQGAEVVRADLDDVESLQAAFAGVHGVFGLTNFWEHFSAEKEKAQAKNIADAARLAQAGHVIWSTLEDTRLLMTADDTRMPMLQTHYRVPHCDGKAEADVYFADLPTTYLITSSYWDNLYGGLAPQKSADGGYQWTWPLADKRLPGIAVQDIGKVAYAIFKAGGRFIGTTMGIASEFLTIPEMGTQLSDTLGIGPVTYHKVSPEAYRNFGFPGADDAGNMFQVFCDFETQVMARRDPALARELVPDLLSFRQFLEKHGSRIPV